MSNASCCGSGALLTIVAQWKQKNGSDSRAAWTDQLYFTSAATPERAMLEGVIPFQARVRLPWERLPEQDSFVCNGSGRRPQDRHNKFLTRKNEGTVPRNVSGKTFWGWVAVFSSWACLCAGVSACPLVGVLGRLGRFCPVSGPSVAMSSVACPLVLSGCFFPPTAGSLFLSMFWGFGSLHQKHRVGGIVVCVVTDQMVGARRSPGATTLGAEIVYFLRQPSPASPADRFRTP